MSWLACGRYGEEFIFDYEPYRTCVYTSNEEKIEYWKGFREGKYVDEVMTVDDNDAIRTAVEFAEKESVLIGISSGAAVYAAIEIAKTIGAGKKVLAIAPDGGEKYISMGIYGEMIK